MARSSSTPSTGSGAVVHWRFTGAAETAATLDAADAWLAPAERERARAFRIERRRRDWLAGRLNLKALLVDVIARRCGVCLSPVQVTIEREVSGAPFVALAPGVAPAGLAGDAGRLPISISNSHAHGRALSAAMWTDGEQTESGAAAAAVGVDLEWIEPRSAAFVYDFLSAAEQQYWRAARGEDAHLRANLAWSAKESVLKVLQRGLTVDTWWLTCLPSDSMLFATGGRAEEHGEVRLDPERPPWSRFSVWTDRRLQADDVRFSGRWRTAEGFVLTLAVGFRDRAATKAEVE
jgi:phosphopantetheinyl transferase